MSVNFCESSGIFNTFIRLLCYTEEDERFLLKEDMLMQTILVCDDDKQIVEAINIYLTGEGFRVIKAYDGYEALELLEKTK